jgi:hypothetical protein
LHALVKEGRRVWGGASGRLRTSLPEQKNCWHAGHG